MITPFFKCKLCSNISLSRCKIIPIESNFMKLYSFCAFTIVHICAGFSMTSWIYVEQIVTSRQTSALNEHLSSGPRSRFQGHFALSPPSSSLSFFFLGYQMKRIESFQIRLQHVLGHLKRFWSFLIQTHGTFFDAREEKRERKLESGERIADRYHSRIFSKNIISMKSFIIHKKRNIVSKIRNIKLEQNNIKLYKCCI